jgi:hypothetical protein
VVCSWEAETSNVLIYFAILQFNHGDAEMPTIAGIHNNLNR